MNAFNSEHHRRLAIYVPGIDGCPACEQFPNFFFFNDTPTTELYTTYDTLSLHDALPILHGVARRRVEGADDAAHRRSQDVLHLHRDRKSTRLNSSHRRLSRMPSSA